MPSKARQKKIMEKLNKAQKCPISGSQNPGPRGIRAPGPPHGSAPGEHSTWIFHVALWHFTLKIFAVVNVTIEYTRVFRHELYSVRSFNFV